MELEGVTKFTAEHAAGDVDVPAELLAWRAVLHALGLIGRDAARYGGVGFGNVSVRAGAGFIVSGTQTSERDEVSGAHFARVVEHDVRRNWVRSVGGTPPSSESMTHGAIYDVSPSAQAVLHVHAPRIFAQRARLGVPRTAPNVEYGTPQMAEEFARILGEAPSTRLIVMEGHEDGVVSLGATCEEAGLALVALHARSLR